MKLIKWILNLLLLVISYCIISLCTFGIYTGVAFQADDKTARISLVNKTDSVDYWDTWELMGDDLSYSFQHMDLPSPKVRTASWFSWSWWKTVGFSIDKYVVNPVTAVVKDVVLPVTVADEIKTYYDKDITDFEAYINETSKTANSFSSMATTYFNVNIGVTATSEGNKVNHDDLVKNKDVFTLENLTEDKDNNGKEDVFDVADDYNHEYQLLYKLWRYNATTGDITNEDGTIVKGEKVFAKWYDKYITVTQDGTRILSTGVYGLYFLNYANMILAVLFVWLILLLLREKMIVQLLLITIPLIYLNGLIKIDMKNG